jgi:hypothetical protein
MLLSLLAVFVLGALHGYASAGVRLIGVHALLWQVDHFSRAVSLSHTASYALTAALVIVADASRAVNLEATTDTVCFKLF